MNIGIDAIAIVRLSSQIRYIEDIVDINNYDFSG